MDLNEFKKGLMELAQKDSSVCEKPSIPKGGNVIRYIMDLELLSDIDFDSFSIEDCEFVMEYLESLPFIYDESGESFWADPHNPLMVYYQQRELLSDFLLNKQKIYRQMPGDKFL